MLGDTFAVTSANRFVSFNRGSPGTLIGATAITGLANGENVVGADVRPADNNLYILTNQNNLYTVNTTSGAAMLVAPLTAAPGDPFTGLTATNYGVDVNPAVDQLRVVGDNGQNLRVNLTNGQTTTDATLVVAGQTKTGITAVSYGSNFSNTCRTAVSLIDTANGQVFTSANLTGGVLTLSGAGNTGLGAGQIGAVSAYEIVTSGTTAPQDLALAALTTNNTTMLFTITLSAGTAVPSGAIGGLNGGETIVGLGILPPQTAPQQALGALLGINTTNTLVSFNQANPNRLCTSQAVSGLQAGDQLLAIDTRPSNNALYALAGPSGSSATALYIIDPSTSTATTRIPLTQPLVGNAEFAFEFNPIADAIRVISDTGNNYVVAVGANGSTPGTVNTNQTQMTPAPGSGPVSIVGLSYSNNFSGTSMIGAYALDATNDQLMTIGLGSGSAGNGDLLPVATLQSGGQRLDFGPASSLETNGVNNMGLAALNLAGTNTTELHAINLATGVNTRINTIGPAGGNVGVVRDITFARNPAATVVGVTSNNNIATFNALTPGQFISGPSTIQGLQAGESVVGIDMRPLDGSVVALTSLGRYLTVNPATGATTVLSTIQGAQLTGTNFGPDFNPLTLNTSGIRVFSDNEQNIVNIVDTGQTASNVTNLSRAPFAVTAVAYDNNTPNSTRTVYYALDTDNDLLLTIPPPDANSSSPTGGGVLTSVGSLGVDLESTASFDIVGINTAFAAGTPNNAGNPVLYSINLTTGAATSVATLNIPGGLDGPTRITGLSTPINANPTGPLPFFAIVNGVGLVSFTADLSTTGGTITTSGRTRISGLKVGERIIGADFRARDPNLNNLYVVAVATNPATNNGPLLGTLYTVNTAQGPNFGVATPVGPGTLSQGGAPFGFAVSNNVQVGFYGFDFNPVADAIRVQNDQVQIVAGTPTPANNFGQNLAVVVAGANIATVVTQTGLTFPTAPRATPVPIDLVGLAYTANYVAGPPIRAMSLDAVSGSLFRTDTPSGRSNLLGRVLAPGQSFTGMLGFDIVGGEDGLSLAALQITGQPQSMLYRIDPRTGGSMPIGNIGPAGTPPITGLAILLQ
jgi:hypothetical protein